MNSYRCIYRPFLNHALLGDSNFLTCLLYMVETNSCSFCPKHKENYLKFILWLCFAKTDHGQLGDNNFYMVGTKRCSFHLKYKTNYLKFILWLCFAKADELLDIVKFT